MIEEDAKPVLSLNVRNAARQLYYRRNIAEFLPRELKISTKGIGIYPFVPNVVQVPVLEGIEKQLKETGKIRQLWFKCRQPGSSTLASGIIWHKTALWPGVNSFIVAQDKTTVARIFKMHDLFHRQMSPEVRPTRQYFTKGTHMVLGDQSGSGITSELLVGEAKNESLGVGSTIHCLHLSEITRYPSEAALTESLLPACSDYPGTIRIIESTAYFGGCADYFRDQCERAMKGKGEYQYHFIPWWKLPEYAIPLTQGEKLRLDYSGDYPDEKHLIKKMGLTLENIKWRRSKIDEYRGDVSLFYLSYPMNFEEGWIPRDASAFPYGRLTEMLVHIRPPSRRFTISEGRILEDEQGALWVWNMPSPNKTYDIGGDVAGGDGATDGTDGERAGDYSVAEVIERGTLEQCAEWRGHVLPREFGDILNAIGKMYNTAQIAPEYNTFGMSTIDRLWKELSYPNLYQWRKRDTIAPKFSGKWGWVTGYESKNFIVNTYREKLYYRQTIFHSKVLWDEMRNFVRDLTPTGMITYRGSRGYDDCTMAMLIAVQTSEDENMLGWSSPSVRSDVQQKSEGRIEGAWLDVDGLTFDDQQDESLQVDTRNWN